MTVRAAKDISEAILETVSLAVRQDEYDYLEVNLEGQYQLLREGSQGTATFTSTV